MLLMSMYYLLLKMHYIYVYIIFSKSDEFKILYRLHLIYANQMNK